MISRIVELLLGICTTFVIIDWIAEGFSNEYI